MKAKTVTILMALVLVSVTGAAQQSVNLDVKLVKTEPVPLQTSEYADVWVKVVNTGSTTATDASIEYVPRFPFQVDPDEKVSWELGRMVPGQEYHIHFQVKVDENAVHGTNDLRFVTDSMQGLRVEKDIPVEVRTDDEALVITDLSFPERVGPGTSNTMDITMSNLADSYLKNIDTRLEIGDSLPFVTSETTRRRVQQIAPGESATVSYILNIDEDADSGAYKLPINLSYENEAGTGFTEDQKTGVIVGGEPVLEAGLNSKDIDTAGRRGTVTLRLVNRGEGHARFVGLELAGSDSYEILSPRSVYLGNMQADDYQTADFDLYVEESAEDVSLPVRITYRDASGDTRTVEQDVPLRLYSAEQLSTFNAGNGTSMWVFVVGGVLVAGGIYWWRRRKR